MASRVLVSDKLASEGLRILQDSGFEVDTKYDLSPEQLREEIRHYQALVIRSGTKVTAEVISRADSLKVIGRAGVGVDNVDIEAASKKGIIVMNAPGGNTISTCEHACALMLAVARNIPPAAASMKSGKWDRSKFKGKELNAKILGIIGFGRIGKEVAKRALAFGMKVLVHDPFVSQEVAARIGVELAQVDDILCAADFITMHTPLTEKTKGMIGAAEISKMKSSAYLINCARGGIIDETALYQACKEGKIAGAALDVFEKEPPLESPLRELENVLMTPHLGASTAEAQVQVAIECAQCVKDALQGNAIRNAVNYVQLDPETYRMIEPYFRLSETMGKFLSQIVSGGISKVHLSYLGEISSFNVDVLSSSFMKGFLSGQVEENTNYINALAVAKERGIKIEQSKIREEQEYVNSIRVKVMTDSEERTLEGTLFANKEARFVRLDDFLIEVAPSPHMLVIHNWDKPGVIGFLGTLLGDHGANIAGMTLGRRAPQDIALTILNLDNSLTDEVIRKISAHKEIAELKHITL
ncbi:MAG: phosphoglycerate dehydrogenase [Candidatus Omnitrophica bacterium]|nr:phosphoglycerate dehydrogenase [Candidatus Omnitrophota bacterium]